MPEELLELDELSELEEVLELLDEPDELPELDEPEELPELDELLELEGAGVSPSQPASSPDAATTAAPFIKSRREMLHFIRLTSCI